MEQETEIKATELPKEVIGALADAFGKSLLTIERWVEKESIMLTTDTAKEVFTRKGIEWPLSKTA